jgi:hypothetical protein
MDSGFAALRRPGMTAQMHFVRGGRGVPPQSRPTAARRRRASKPARRKEDGETPMAETATHVFRVSLDEKLYRDIEIPSAKKLYDLAAAIVAAFGFFFDHPFGFYSLLEGNIEHSPVQYELFADLDDIGEPSTAGSVERTRIFKAFPEVGDKMTFLFDYGDRWEFRIEVIGRRRKETGVNYPRVIKKIGSAPKQYAPEGKRWRRG